MVLLLFYLHRPPQAEGMSEHSDEIPVRDLTTKFYAFHLARALPAGTRDVGAQRRNPGESLTRIVYREIRIGLCMTEAYSVLVFTSYLHVTEICRITELLV